MVGLGKTLVKEKRLFYETEILHMILYTTYVPYASPSDKWQ